MKTIWIVLPAKDDAAPWWLPADDVITINRTRYHIVQIIIDPVDAAFWTGPYRTKRIALEPIE